jgi:hypothetical protein
VDLFFVCPCIFAEYLREAPTACGHAENNKMGGSKNGERFVLFLISFVVCFGVALFLFCFVYFVCFCLYYHVLNKGVGWWW